MRKNDLAILIWVNFICFTLSTIIGIIGIYTIWGAKSAVVSGFLLFLVEFVFGVALFNIYDESCLFKGETRKIAKEKKKIAKLEAEQKYLEKKKQNEEKSAVLECKIHNLKMEIEGKLTVCKNCGKRIYKNSCYCPKCGTQIK